MNEFISYFYSKLFIYKKGRQDEIKPYNDLTIAEKLNVDADTIATTCATKPINIHLPSTHFVIYAKGDYIHLSPHNGIREVTFEDEAQHFFKQNIGGTLLPPMILNGDYNRCNSTH